MCYVLFGDRHLEAENFIAVAVGDDRGDTLSQFAEQLGGRTYQVDMKGNPFAAGRTLIDVLREMKAGRQLVMAPDGPDGPPFAPKDGVSYLARKGGAAVIPTGAWTRQAYQLDRWDRYMVPLPFARIHVAIGEPIFAERGMEQDALQAQITKALHEARTRAQTLAGVRPWR